MGLTPVTGFNIVNNVLKIFRVKIPINAPGIKVITRFFLLRELRMYFAKIRREDALISMEGLQKYSEKEIDKLCFMRGIDITQPLKDKVSDLKLWLSISNQRNVTNTLLLFIRVNDFTHDKFEISEDEDQEEVLRRSPTNTYYLEKMKVFEETFGIDKLLYQVDRIAQKV